MYKNYTKYINASKIKLKVVSGRVFAIVKTKQLKRYFLIVIEAVLLKVVCAIYMLRKQQDES